LESKVWFNFVLSFKPQSTLPMPLRSVYFHDAMLTTLGDSVYDMLLNWEIVLHYIEYGT